MSETMTDAELDAVECHLGDACECESAEDECLFCDAVEAITALRRRVAELLDVLADTSELADAAMAEANRDGAEYDRKAELADARAAIAKEPQDA